MKVFEMTPGELGKGELAIAELVWGVEFDCFLFTLEIRHSE